MRQHSEQGQALILLVLAVVGLLGFAALAIDGGMVYSDRRYAQNAADASSLAGGSAAALYLENSFVNYENFRCTDGYVRDAQSEAIAAAISRAASNDFAIDGNITDMHGVTTVCVDNYNNGSFVEKYIDIRVLITFETATSFAHFVYKGPLVNTVEAVTRIRPRTQLAFGHAIVSLNADECKGNQNGVIFGGSSVNLIKGGGVFSNGCLVGNGTKFSVDVYDGYVSYAGSAIGTLDNIDPDPGHVPLRLPSYSYGVPTPDCGPNRGSSSGGGIIQPGTYSKITLSTGTLEMKSGLYCITGSPDAIKFTGGTVKGEGITLYVTSGDVSISGNVDLSKPGLSAPKSSDPSPAIRGVLIYLAEGNNGTVDLEGNSKSEYYGLIYAPDGDIKITGTPGATATYHAQFVGKNVEVSGNADLNIKYQGSDIYWVPANLELFK